MNWVFYALLSALFAALTAILAKVGVKDVNSNLATAIRTIVILIFAWAIVFFQQTHKQLPNINKTSLAFLLASGLTTAASWIFYFRALQLGDASKVAPVDKMSLIFTILLALVFLHEKLTLSVFIGAVLMTAGVLVITIIK